MLYYKDLTPQAQLKALDNLREKTLSNLDAANNRQESLRADLDAAKQPAVKEGVSRAINFNARCISQLTLACDNQLDTTYCINLMVQMGARFTPDGEIKELTAEQIKAKRNRMLKAAGFNPLED